MVEGNHSSVYSDWARTLMSRLKEFRKSKDQFFGGDHDSPLEGEQRRDFKGLAYFPENRDLVIDAPLDTAVEPGEVRMQTSTGEEQVYRRAGKLRFAVGGEQAELTLYTSPSQHDLFLPFRDATSGTETYGAGRYLEVAPARDGRVVVDFNYAYNPYCAYNARWSCPLPPTENWLKVPIRAGEKNFPGEAH